MFFLFAFLLDFVQFQYKIYICCSDYKYGFSSFIRSFIHSLIQFSLLIERFTVITLQHRNIVDDLLHIPNRQQVARSLGITILPRRLFLQIHSLFRFYIQVKCVFFLKNIVLFFQFLRFFRLCCNTSLPLHLWVFIVSSYTLRRELS